MNFDFSEEQYAFRDSIRELLSRRCPAPPDAGADTVIEPEFWRAELSALGLYAALVPEEYGGLGLGWVDLTLALEEMGRRLVPASVIDTLVATEVIAHCASGEQKALYLPAIAKGEVRIALATQEAGFGLGPRDNSTRLSRSADGIMLDGQKIMVADAESAEVLMVSARMDGHGAFAFVERDHRGIACRPHQTLDLTSRYDNVSLSNVEVAQHQVLAGLGAKDAEARLLNSAALASALMLTGIASTVFDRTLSYVKERHQFGRPIGAFQAIKHRCADMAMMLESSRSAVYYAAWALANDAPDRDKAVSIAKSYGGDAARSICNEGTQLHGGMGFTWDLGLHFYLRRAKVLEHSHGNATFHRRRLLEAALTELGVSR
jgi:alkylation response protein AidB-like acyl-CoA dehydrogenase